MPKTRRAGRKYQMRKVLAQLQELVPATGLLSVLGSDYDYTHDATSEVQTGKCRDSSTSSSQKQQPATCSDGRPLVPTATQSYRLIPVDVPPTWVDIEQIEKTDPRYGFYASRQRVSSWINDQLPNGATHVTFVPRAIIQSALRL